MHKFFTLPPPLPSLYQLLLPNPDALNCYGAALQVFPCNDGPCPSDCLWGPWTPWSSCEPRNSGAKKRYRRDGTGHHHHGHDPHGGGGHAPHDPHGGGHASHDPHGGGHAPHDHGHSAAAGLHGGHEPAAAVAFVSAPLPTYGGGGAVQVCTQVSFPHSLLINCSSIVCMFNELYSCMVHCKGKK
jgi:hypothetical protein